LPSGAFVSVFGESLNDFSIWEALAPLASGPSGESTGVENTVLTLSGPLSDDLALSSSTALDSSETWFGEKLAFSSISYEISD